MCLNVMRLTLPLDGYFQAMAETIGTNGDELHSIETGSLPPERFGVIMNNLHSAALALSQVDVAGRC